MDVLLQLSPVQWSLVVTDVDPACSTRRILVINAGQGMQKASGTVCVGIALLKQLQGGVLLQE